MKTNTKELLKLQASFMVWYQKTKNFHWHLKDPMFFELHEELDKSAEAMLGFVDDFAEKVVMQNHFASATLSDNLKLSIIKEVEAKHLDQAIVVESIKTDAQLLLKEATSVEWGPTEQPLLDEVFMFLDKTIWMYSANKK